MRAKDMVFDFLETIFFLSCILFFIFYLFFGGHLDIAKKIFQTAAAVSVFGILLVIKWKFTKEQIRKKEKEGGDSDIIAYLDKRDIMQDRIFFISVPFFVVLVSIFVNVFNPLDFLQAFTAMFYMSALHLILFSKRETNVDFVSLTELDKIKDETAIMFLSMILLIETLFGGGATIVDFAQIGFIYFSSYWWHKHIFNSNS